jgi:uncharacterized protein
MYFQLQKPYLLLQGACQCTIFREQNFCSAAIPNFNGLLTISNQTEYKTMRLDTPQIERIMNIVSAHAGSESRVSIYGSRLDDRARGGDIDLFIETEAPMPGWDQARMLAALEDELGLPVDILVKYVHAPDTPFESMIKARAVALNQAAP